MKAKIIIQHFIFEFLFNLRANKIIFLIIIIIIKKIKNMFLNKINYFFN